MPVEVHIVTPEREVWSGESDLVVARGTDGEVGIQAGHMPLLVRLAIGPLRIMQGSGETVMAVDGGFMHVATDADVTRVDVMADAAIAANEIDVAAEQTRKAEAESRANDGDAFAQRIVKRAESRIALAQQ